MRISLALLLIAITSALPLAGQPPADPPQATVLHRDARGLPTWVAGRLGELDPRDLESSAVRAFPDLVNRYFPATGRESFQKIHVSQDSAGRSHVRFQEVLRGLPVVGAELNLHADSATGEVVGINGRFAPDKGLPAQPRLSAEQALAMAQAEAGVVDGQLEDGPTLTYVLPPDAERIYLAWGVEIRYQGPDGERLDRLFADAETGALVGLMPLQFSLRKRQTYTLNNQMYVLPGTPVICDSTAPIEGCPTSSSDSVAQTAHNHTGTVYNFHYLVFRRDSIDNNGKIMKSTVHRGLNLNEAGYTGGVMWYGDGDGSLFTHLGNALDIVAHEVQHGVNLYTAGGVMGAESMALHEALCDMFAAAVEAWMDGGVNSDTWKLGEDVYTPAIPGDALRYLNDPMLDGQSVDFYPEFDYAGDDPHLNAGILNLGFYLLTQGGTHPRGKSSVALTGIGISKAQVILNDALSYLFSAAGYSDMRLAMTQAAVAKYGVSSAEHVAVRDAFCAVGFDCSDSVGPVQFVDRPSHNQSISGNFLAQGWATDASGVSAMRFEVDNQPVTLSSFVYGTSRADVCAAYSSLNDPNCPYVGWQGTLNTAAFVSGRHLLKVTAFDEQGNPTVFNRWFYSTRVATFNATADTWVNQLSPNTNYGSSTDLRVRSAATGSGHHSYLKFTVSGITVPIQSAVLRIRTQSVAFPSARVYYMVSNSWNESTLTWNNASLDINFQYPIGALSANTWQQIDVSSIVKGNGTYTIGLVAADMPGLAYWSRESVYKPTLEVTY